MKFPATYETEVYTNDNGHLVIHQMQEHGEAFVAMPLTLAKLLVKEIRRLAAEGDLRDCPPPEEIGS